MGGSKWTLLPYLALSAEFLLASAAVSSGCAGTPDRRTAPHGLIRSPQSWGVNQVINCSWIIEASSADRVTISFPTFHLPCSLGSLTLGRLGHHTRELCGGVRPPPLSFTGGSVLIHLQMGLTHRQVLRLSYTTAPACPPGRTPCSSGDCSPDPLLCPPPPSASPSAPAPSPAPCPPRHLRSFSGTFSSPDAGAAPSRRRPPLACSWLLETGDPRPLELTLELRLGAGDRLQLSPGTRDRDPPLADVPGPLVGPRGTPVTRTLLVPGGSARLRYVSAGGEGAGGGFSATFHAQGYCPPGRTPCRDAGTPSCFSPAQRCDGSWDCELGADEEGCPGCRPGDYPCGAVSSRCYRAAERCNYQAACPGAADERGCRHCQPGTVPCAAEQRCVFEAWRCDGQPDCADGSDEEDCGHPPPRRLATAAALGSLVCGLLLVVALGCACRLHRLRSGHRSLFTALAPMEAEAVQQHAPPSYGQLIADGAIPPVDDFPTENPNDVSVLGNLRSVLHFLRQGAAPPHRRRRNRTARRLLRRLRRSRLWGLVSPTRVTPSAEPGPPQPSPDTPTPAPAKPGLPQDTPSPASDPSDLPLLPLPSLEGADSEDHLPLLP